VSRGWLVVLAHLQNILAYVIVHCYVNDGTYVRICQDGCVDERHNEQEAPAQPQPTRMVGDVETLKALADPTRMAILSVLARSRDLPAMSVKELAAELGEPQTKLYRHVRQLEEAGLIRVAATRMVSGILEQRYQACLRDLRFTPGMLREHLDDTEVALQLLLDDFRDGVLEATSVESERRPVLISCEAMIAPAAADELKRRLQELNDWVEQLPEDRGGVAANLLIGLYTHDPR
jgi:DNA-binding transcriptional ArsR family regulator